MTSSPPARALHPLAERDLRVVWHPCTQMKDHEWLPLTPIERGEGAWLYGYDGRRYLDAISSWWVNLFGHANPRINAAITAQLGRLEHVILAGFTHEPAVQLADPPLARELILGADLLAANRASLRVRAVQQIDTIELSSPTLNLSRWRRHEPK